jgi:hypothetical protein
MPSVPGPASVFDILQTHPDVLSCYNSAPLANNVISGSAPLAPGANQPLTVAGGNANLNLTARPFQI